MVVLIYISVVANEAEHFFHMLFFGRLSIFCGEVSVQTLCPFLRYLAYLSYKWHQARLLFLPLAVCPGELPLAVPEPTIVKQLLKLSQCAVL